MAFPGLTAKTKIPLNPRLIKGDLLNPSFLKAGRGDFSPTGVRQTFDFWTFRSSIILVPFGVAIYCHVDFGIGCTHES